MTMSSPVRFALLLTATAAMLAGSCSREAPETNDAGSPATVGRTATAPRPEDIAATETLADQQAGARGQAAFIDEGCAMCHAVTSANVRGMSDAGPDLAGVGARHGGAGAIASFLRSGDHPKRWDGTDADLNAVAEWLAAQ
jgi:mono/diheme cytochrome c family protein